VVFPRLRGVRDATRFAERLAADYDLAVAPGHFFEAAAHFRLGIGGTPAAVDAALAQLRRARDARAWE
jgi:aspartate/methionine/tyrosine aminotransferase